MSTFKRQTYVFKLKVEDGETEIPCVVVLYLNMFDMNAKRSRTKVLENQIFAWK
jgi:hypothetical protein